MNKIDYILIQLLGFAFISCTESNNKFGKFDTSHCISIESLLKRSSEFDEKIVCLKGRISIKFEGNSISSGGNRVWVRWSSLNNSLEELRNCHTSTGFVEGLYKKNSKGHLGMFNGSMNFLTRVKCMDKIYLSEDNSYIEEYYNYEPDE